MSVTEIPLASWNEGDTKAKLLSFIAKVSDQKSADYVPPAERIATFDNDGTLWSEFPLQTQVYFTLHRVQQLAEQNPAMREQQPFKALLEGDLKTLAALGKRAVFEIVAKTHSGMSTDEFAELAGQFLAEARHPQLERLFTDCVYQPQLELLAWLRAHQFKTFIVSGGGADFMRCFAERAYGIPPEQIIGSSVKTALEFKGNRMVLNKLPDLASFDDRDEKVVNIDLHIGRRPILAFGNSDGDLSMLRFAGGKRPALKLLLHHDDAAREFAYDKEFRLSPLNEALQVADREAIQVVSMKRDWKSIFPPSA